MKFVSHFLHRVTTAQRAPYQFSGLLGDYVIYNFKEKIAARQTFFKLMSCCPVKTFKKRGLASQNYKIGKKNRTIRTPTPSLIFSPISSPSLSFVIWSLKGFFCTSSLKKMHFAPRWQKWRRLIKQDWNLQSSCFSSSSLQENNYQKVSLRSTMAFGE